MSDPAPVNRLPQDSGNVTKLLLEWGDGDHSALERLTPIIYDDLLRLARARLSRENRACTLQPTSLVHECYLRLADSDQTATAKPGPLLCHAANTMRRVLIDYARKRSADKRGGGIRITLRTDMDIAGERTSDLLMLDEALARLTERDERKSRVIVLKFFGGMTTEEISLAVGISVATVGRELRFGQAWLRRAMSRTHA